MPKRKDSGPCIHELGVSTVFQNWSVYSTTRKTSVLNKAEEYLRMRDGRFYKRRLKNLFDLTNTEFMSWFRFCPHCGAWLDHPRKTFQFPSKSKAKRGWVNPKRKK